MHSCWYVKNTKKFCIFTSMALEDRINDMTLSEFIGHTDVSMDDDGAYRVKVPTAKGPILTIVIDNCYSEFDAQEKAFLYLQRRIYNKQEQEEEDFPEA